MPAWIHGFALASVLCALILGMQTAAAGLGGTAAQSWIKQMQSWRPSPLTGVGIGMMVTVLMQSSSAVTIMLVSLTGSGVLKMATAIPLVFGANIGTTLTVQLIAFQPERFGWYLAFAGCLIWLAPSHKLSPLGRALAGFGLIFVALDLFEWLLVPISGTKWFADAARRMDVHPWIGLMSGIALTALVMSSHVTIGLLQRLASEKWISLQAALPVLYGDNIGTTADTLLSSVGAGARGKQLALIHLQFNLLGTLFFWMLTPWLALVLGSLSLDPGRQIAHAHLLFNLVNALLQLPMIRWHVWISAWLLKTGFLVRRIPPRDMF